VETASRRESRNFSGEKHLLARWTRPESLARELILKRSDDQGPADEEEWNASNIPILASFCPVKQKSRNVALNHWL